MLDTGSRKGEGDGGEVIITVRASSRQQSVQIEGVDEKERKLGPLSLVHGPTLNLASAVCACTPLFTTRCNHNILRVLTPPPPPPRCPLASPTLLPLPPPPPPPRPPL
eukprot:SAG22_NODE_2017_length_3130_cov_9.400198_1_plen_107_part_10